MVVMFVAIDLHKCPACKLFFTKTQRCLLSLSRVRQQPPPWSRRWWRMVVDTDEVVAVTEVVVAEADLTAETIAEVEVEVMVAAAVVEDTVRSSKSWGISTEHGTMIFEIMVLVPKYISSMMAEQFSYLWKLTCEICFEVYICDNMGSAACIHPFG
ncbi:hypothetical protein HanRHA438_Chr03g0128751 [Helianthus annuus]|nr:hypothetical protein HanRHA438_Chr03g0128751 [Helianthus annuus]